jgi:hypothetical protein
MPEIIFWAIVMAGMPKLTRYVKEIIPRENAIGKPSTIHRRNPPIRKIIAVLPNVF